MPISRPSEVPQRPSPTLRGPRHLRTSSSDSDPLHQRHVKDSSPKLRIVDRRSPRSAQSDPVGQKKLGTRITDLETQLVQAQQELKSLKHQLSSAEAAKKQAQDKLNGNRKKAITSTTRKVQGREKKPPTVVEPQESDPREMPDDEVSEEIDRETDVFEVPVEKMLVDEPKAEVNQCPTDEILEPEKPSLCNESVPKGEEMEEMRTKMEEKEKENEALKQELEEAKAQIASAKSKEEEMTSELSQLGKELEASKENAANLEERLLEAEAAKELFEAEMKKMRVQTEQWRKAADAAASVLAGEGGVHQMNGRVSGRCASMDNHFHGVFEPHVVDGFGGGYLASPGDDNDDGLEGVKKKGSGIRMLGDLWKKKGQK